MIYDTWTITSTSAESTIDLRLNQNGDQKISGQANKIANFDIEVVANDAAVTMTGKGSFASSVFHTFTDGTFAIGGGKRSISGFALSELKFTRTGTTSYTINITRQIGD